MAAATQTELARRLGVSRSTVAAALNPNSPVHLRASTIERIRREAEKCQYRPNRNARLVRGEKSRTIGIIHYGGLSQVAAERAAHASRAIGKSGYDVLSTDLSWLPGGARAGCGAMLDAQVEGVVVAGLNDSASLGELAALQRHRIPLVMLSGNRLPCAPHVRGDARQAMRSLAEHLIGLGRRRLILLSHDPSGQASGGYSWAFSERQKGFQEALARNGGRRVDLFTSHRKPPLEGRVIASAQPADPFDPHRAGYSLMRDILQKSPLPDAVLCGNDDWALGAMTACFQTGISVPETVAVTGYDNNAFGRYLTVPLTTIAQPNEAMAEYAVTRLLRMISSGTAVKRADVRLFPCELIVRSSCGVR